MCSKIRSTHASMQNLQSRQEGNSFSSTARDGNRRSFPPTFGEAGKSRVRNATRRFAKSRAEHRRLAEEFNAEVGAFIASQRYVCRSLNRTRGQQTMCLRKMRKNHE